MAHLAGPCLRSVVGLATRLDSSVSDSAHGSGSVGAGGTYESVLCL